MWDRAAKCIRESAREVLGVSRGRAGHHRGDWWWNEEVGKKVETKKEAYAKLVESKDEEEKRHLKEEVVSMSKKLELLENSKRRLLGEDLDSSSIDELEQAEEQLDLSLRNIRARKNQLFREQISLLKYEEKVLVEENAELREKVRHCIVTNVF
ncbi:Agamous-like MADS-box protein AGL19 [Capsicum chinense]|nr:Agamous-like MADS-box protein AGL19 [Capsicum chinense]